MCQSISRGKANTNALLSSLTLSSGVMQFSPTVYEYETKVLNSISSIDVYAAPQKETSTAKVVGNTNLKVGLNTITVTVTSQKGTTQNYVIKVTRLNEGETLGDNANIKNILITGYDLMFDFSRTSYKLVIKNEERSCEVRKKARDT